MLLEISSDKFVQNGIIRPKIKFNSGLNIVLGDGNKSNSIGKSTFLMIVDFCFGGSDYVKGKDIINNIGHHEIHFAFKFGNEIYYFSRKTDNIQEVNICNEKYEITDLPFKIDEFRKFLKKKYALETDLTFREVISKYLRIYGRDVTKELKPLAIANEAEDKSVKRVLRLFKFDFSEQEKKAELEKTKNENFQSLIKTGVQEKVGKRDFDSNTKVIEQKKEEITKISENFIGTEEAENIANIKAELNRLKRQKLKAESEKSVSLESKNDLSFDTDTIQELFPALNIKKLEEVEKFHEDITLILNEEIQQEILEKQSIINIIDNQISQLENKLTKFSSFGNISRKQLALVQENQHIMDELENKNKVYNQEQKLKQASNDARDNLNQIIRLDIEKIAQEINNQLKIFNSEIFNDVNRVSAQITFRLSKSQKWLYEYKTVGDTGTGTAFKSLILFDLTILKNTALPAVVHDSFLFTDIENSTVSEILKLYRKFDKQIIIALTDKENYTDSETQKLIAEREILSLSPNGNELFGKSWKTNP